MLDVISHILIVGLISFVETVAIALHDPNLLIVRLPVHFTLFFSPHTSVVSIADENSREQLLNLTTSHKRTSDDAGPEPRFHPAPAGSPRDTSLSTTDCHSSEPHRVRTLSGTNRSDSVSSHSDAEEKPDIARTIKYPIASHYQAMLLSSASMSGLRSQIPFPFFPVSAMPEHQVGLSSNVRPLANGFAHSNAFSNYLYPQFNPSHALASVAATTGGKPVGPHQQPSFPNFLCPPGFGMPPLVESPTLPITPKRRRVPNQHSKIEPPEQESSSIGQYLSSPPSTSSGLPDGYGSRDEAYAERRRKNNEAAKRSRDLRRIKEQETALQARQLYEENIRLKVQLQYLAEQLAVLRNGYGGR